MIRTGILGTLPNGLLAHTYTLIDEDVSVTISNWGATILSIKTPDTYGNVRDIALGFDNLAGYTGKNPAFYGASIGPVCNRSDNAEIIFNDETYKLEQNDGPTLQNNLHSSITHGLHKRLWGAKIDREHNAVVMSVSLENGELGLPGERTFTARFELSSLNATHQQLRVSYTCTTNKPTFVNMTNHTYFNLAGHDAGSVLNHEMRIYADKFLPIREDSVSEGSILDVAETPFDFRHAHAIGDTIHAQNMQLTRARGYDHCFCINGYTNNTTLRSALNARDPKTGRHLHIAISAPGGHFYTGNWLDDKHAKDGANYKPQSGFAFEPEFYPDCSHHPAWPQPSCTPQKPYCSTIVYTFSHDMLDEEEALLQDSIYDM